MTTFLRIALSLLFLPAVVTPASGAAQAIETSAPTSDSVVARYLAATHATDWNRAARTIDSADVLYFAGNWISIGNTEARARLINQGYQLPPAGSLALYEPTFLTAEVMRTRASAAPTSYPATATATYSVASRVELTDSTVRYRVKQVESATGRSIASDLMLSTIRRPGGWYLRLPEDLDGFMAGLLSSMQNR